MPFLDLNRSGEYFNLSATNIVELNNVFDHYFFAVLNENIKKIQDLKTDQYSWKFLALGIKEFIQKQRKRDTWATWIKFYINLKNTFNDRLEKNIQKYNEISEIIANDILYDIKNNIKLFDNLIKEIEVNSGKPSEVEIDEETIDLEEEESEVQQENEIKLFRVIRTICRKKSATLFDKNIKLTKLEQDIYKHISKFIENRNLKELGELSILIKNFRRILNGPVINIFSRIPTIYKSFRKILLLKYLTLRVERHLRI